MVKHLFELQDIEKLLLDKKILLEEIEKGEEIKKVIIKDKKTRKEIAIIKKKSQRSKEDINLIEEELQGFEETKKNIKAKLYGGKIKDTKKLELLIEKEKEIDVKINSCNEELIEKYEIQEKLEINLKKHIDYCNKLSNHIDNLLKERKSNKIKLIKEIEKLEKKVSDIKKIIDEELLLDYEDIKKKKRNPIVKIDGVICGGCHMDIPLQVMEKIKKGNIQSCPNCNRLIVLDEE